MAQVSVSLRLEVDLVHDGVSTLKIVHERLASRHGVRFRKLEREIEALAERGPESTDVALVQVGDGTFMSVPAGKFKFLLAEARQLGVIR